MSTDVGTATHILRNLLFSPWFIHYFTRFCFTYMCVYLVTHTHMNIFALFCLCKVEIKHKSFFLCRNGYPDSSYLNHLAEILEAHGIE